MALEHPLAQPTLDSLEISDKYEKVKQRWALMKHEVNTKTWTRDLWVAVREADPIALDALLRRPPLVDVPADTVSSSNELPFHALCKVGAIQCLQVLLRHGSKAINSVCRMFKSTPLVTASGCNQVECIRFLLSVGADPAIGAFRPFHVAIKSGSVEAARFWIEHDPTVLELKATYGMNPLHIACTGRSGPMLRLLEEQRRPEWLTEVYDGVKTPLGLAATAVHPWMEGIIFLLRLGSDPLLESVPIRNLVANARSPLRACLEDGTHPDVIDLLISCTDCVVPSLDDDTRQMWRERVWFTESLLSRLLMFV